MLSAGELGGKVVIPGSEESGRQQKVWDSFGSLAGWKSVSVFLMQERQFSFGGIT